MVTLIKILKLFKIKIKLTNPEKKSLLVFDCESERWLKDLLIGIDYFLLSTRFHKIKFIYINFDLLLFMILNFFKRSLKQNYLFGIIRQVNPKLVITMIDNTYDFSITTKYFENKIPFYAIQGANRGDIKTATEKENKKLYLNTFFCFGKYEKQLYDERSIKVKKFIFSGPLKPSLALNYIKKNDTKIIGNEYDICLPTELSLDSPYNSFTNYSESCLTLAEYVHKLCLKHELKLVFSGKAIDHKIREDEINFYNKKLKKYKYYIFPRENNYASYINALKSNLTIGLNTTLLREVFYLKKKVFACNLTQHPYADFPIKNIASPTIKNFNDFEVHALKLLEMKTSEYFEILKDEINKVVNCDERSDKKILNSIMEEIDN